MILANIYLVLTLCQKVVQILYIYIYYFNLYLKTFLLEHSCFIILCQFLLYSNVNQLQVCVCVCVYIYISPFLGFPSHLTHYRSLSTLPCAIQQVLISYQFYTQQCIYVNPNLPIHLISPPPTLAVFYIYVLISLKHFSSIHILLKVTAETTCIDKLFHKKCSVSSVQSLSHV